MKKKNATKSAGAELLLELFSEEIPARMQTRAAEDLTRLVGGGLQAAGLTFDSAQAFATPRRLALVIAGLPKRSPEVNEEKRGPRVGAPDNAVQGFLRGAGLKSIDQAEIVKDERKGDFYVARIKKPGRPTAEIVAELVPDVVRKFPWPKSMRWGDGALRWVRPLHSVLCLLDGKVVRFEVDGVTSGNSTRGHRFVAPKLFPVKNFRDYTAKLRKASVVLDPAERRGTIAKQARKLAQKAQASLNEDEGLLSENAGLTEWPVALMGSFDASFLDLPPEVLSTSMKAHQKCFSLFTPDASRRGPAAPRHEGKKQPHPEEGAQAPVSKDGQTLANRFILVANLEAKDKGKAIIAGNERVIRARLADAKFFWDQDRKTQLEARVPKLKAIVFHEKLGSQYERVQRLRKLARELAPMVGAGSDETERTAILAKADLVTDMVGEFPELQGVMGRYYAIEEGELQEVADAIAEHYKPQGPSDSVPTNPVSIAVALADKLDMLVGFWAINEKPTGSKDPYALRRAALGVIRIVLENELRLPLATALEKPIVRAPGSFFRQPDWSDREFAEAQSGYAYGQYEALLAFFAERLKVQLREQGARHDLVDAVFALGNQDDLLLIVRRVEALGKFLETEDGKNLLVGVKRAINILRIEEKKDGRAHDHKPDSVLLQQAEEKALASAIERATTDAAAAVDKEDFQGAMRAIARLRKPVDDFFDHVTVNADDAKLRENRLRLLNQIRAATLKVADFSKIEG